MSTILLQDTTVDLRGCGPPASGGLSLPCDLIKNNCLEVKGNLDEGYLDETLCCCNDKDQCNGARIANLSIGVMSLIMVVFAIVY